MRYFVKKLTTPIGKEVSLTSYLLDNFAEFDAERKRPAIIICPGGAYRMRSDREAEPIAIKMMSLGLQAFVLNYSVVPARFPTALIELATAVAYVRKNAADFNIDPQQICVGGFSAGGHLAASLAVFWNGDLLKKNGFVPEEIKPNAVLLSYAVLTSFEYTHKESMAKLLGPEKTQDKNELKKVNLIDFVTEQTPPCFLWHTVTDPSVPCENSMLFAQALKKKHVPFELHLFPRGRHGLGLANLESNYDRPQDVVPEVQAWPEMFVRWLHLIFKS